jgi:hypothetical protein
MAGIKFVISLVTDAFQRSLEKVKQSVGGLSDTLNSRLGRIIALSAVVYSFKRLASSLNEIKDSSDRLGVTTETIQKLDYAAKISGTSLGAVEGAIRKIAKALYEVQSGGAGADKLTQTFKVLGLSFEDLKKSNINDLLFKIAEQINKISDPKLKLGILQQIGGRGAGQLMGFFNSLKSASEQLEARGGIIPDAAIKAADDIDDSFTSILTTIKAIAAETGIFQTVAKNIKDVLEGFDALRKGNKLPEGMTSTTKYVDKNFSELTWAQRIESLRNNWGSALLGPAGAGYAIGKTLFGKTKIGEETFSTPPITRDDINKLKEQRAKEKAEADKMSAAYARFGTDKSIEKEKKKAQSLEDELTLIEAKSQLSNYEYEYLKIIVETQKNIADAKSEELKEAQKKLGAAKLQNLYHKQQEEEQSQLSEIKQSTIAAKLYNKVLKKQISDQEYEIYNVRAREAADLAKADKEKASEEIKNAIKEKALADIKNIIDKPQNKDMIYGLAYQAGDLEAIQKASKGTEKTLQEKSLEYQRQIAESTKNLDRKQSNKALYG